MALQVFLFICAAYFCGKSLMFFFFNLFCLFLSAFSLKLTLLHHAGNECALHLTNKVKYTDLMVFCRKCYPVDSTPCPCFCKDP